MDNNMEIDHGHINMTFASHPGNRIYILYQLGNKNTDAVRLGRVEFRQEWRVLRKDWHCDDIHFEHVILSLLKAILYKYRQNLQDVLDSNMNSFIGIFYFCTYMFEAGNPGLTKDKTV